MSAAITARRRGHGLGSRSPPWLRMSSTARTPKDTLIRRNHDTSTARHGSIDQLAGLAYQPKPPAPGRSATSSPWQGGGLVRGKTYTAHIVASGPAGSHVAPFTYSQAVFKTA
jgi:hypothetical protein